MSLSRRSVPAGLATLMALTALAPAGCRKPLLSPDEERSQFDRYDAVRNQRAPQYVTDEFGRRHPDLKGRLLPKD